ncbi:MAG: glutathione S-transferase family protein [Proteobacteria bacterium]|nr:glutathione S-transferase family protein [Pseudomonadota bacterium]
MKLYYHPISTYSQKVLIALYEKGIEFEREIIHLTDPQGRADYLDVYPMGKIPCLIDDGHMVPESSIIIEYIDDMADPKLIKGDAGLSRRIRFKDRMFDLYLNNNVAILLFQSLKPKKDQDQELIDKARFEIDIMYSFMEHEFGNQDYANGHEFLMADCAAAPALNYAQMIAPFDQHKNICKYWERLTSRSSVQRIQEEAAPAIAAFMEKNAA